MALRFLLGLPVLSMILIVATGSALGQTPAAAASSPASRAVSTGPSWSRLTPQQRSALLPLERDWSSLDAPRKTKWLEVAARFPAMPVADQKRVQERMAEWARMTPSERGRARLSFQESKQFSPEQKQAHWEAYQALPDNERRALADRNQPSAVDKPASPASAKHSRVASAASTSGSNCGISTALFPCSWRRKRKRYVSLAGRQRWKKSRFLVLTAARSVAVRAAKSPDSGFPVAAAKTAAAAS